MPFSTHGLYESRTLCILERKYPNSQAVEQTLSSILVRQYNANGIQETNINIDKLPCAHVLHYLAFHACLDGSWVNIKHEVIYVCDG